MLPVETPFKIYTGLDGKPLQNGYVWFGLPNQDPITNPVTVYWDAAGTIPAVQPLRTVNGYIIRSGMPANVFYDGEYSELVRTAAGLQVFYAPSSNDFSVSAIVNKFLSSQGASFIGWIQSGIGAIMRNVQDKLRENVSVQDFSATLLEDNVDVTAALQAAIASRPDGGVIKFPRGKVLLISAEIAMSSRITLDLNRCTLRQASGSNLGNMIFIGAAANDVYIHDGKIDINRANQVYAGAKGDVGRGVFAYQANGTRVYRVDFMNPYGSMILAAACVDTIVERCNFDDQNATGHHGVEFNSCTRPYALWNKGSGKLGLTGYAIYAHGPTIRPWAMFNSFQYWQIDFIGDDYITAGTESTMIYGRIEHNTLLDPSADTSIHFGLYGSVCNNTIINSRDVGISMDYSRNTVINNNVIRTTNAAGIAIPGCIDCTIANNQLSNVGSQFVSPVQDGQRSGIWAPIRPFEIAPSIAPSGNVISGNSIRDSLAVPKMYYGISVANVGGNNVNYVKGNYVFGSIGADLDLPPQTNIGSIEQRKFPVLLNSWVSAGAGVPDLGFYKDDIGNVYLSGIVAGGALNLPIAMLPAGYRPAQKIEFLVRAGTGVGQASIFTDGSILLENGSNTRVSFNLVFTIR